jgi:DDE superfamily endonuclease
VIRRVWAPRGERPIAPGHHRFEWLYVTAFVAPDSGETFWYLSTGIDKRLFEDILAMFARNAGLGSKRIAILVVDNAGWHGEAGLAVPDGIRLVYLPPYTPELQPAEHLWEPLDEAIVNRHFATLAELDQAIATRCAVLEADKPAMKSLTNFPWWPNTIVPK